MNTLRCWFGLNPLELEDGRANAEEKYVYFVGRDDVFSQWYASRFNIGGLTFSCAQQYMMYRKAGKLHYLMFETSLTHDSY